MNKKNDLQNINNNTELEEKQKIQNNTKTEEKQKIQNSAKPKLKQKIQNNTTSEEKENIQNTTDKTDNRYDIIFGIFQKAQQGFRIAVPGAAAHTTYRCV